MSLNVEKELATLRRLTVDGLRSRYAEVYKEPTGARHKDWLVKRIIYRLQVLDQGDLTERARRRASELANDADLRQSPPKVKTVRTTSVPRPQSDSRLPVPGSIITRTYKGELVQVKVLSSGFELEGESYKSLSAVAKTITGSHCNGFHFFRLNNGGNR